MAIDTSGIRTQSQILGNVDGSGNGFREFIQALTVANDGIDGKTIDTTDPEFLIQAELAPVALELSNIYIIDDFKDRSIDVNKLLEVDNDPTYKANLQSALHTTAAGVQSLIDTLFDYQGSNVNKPRKTQSQAIGFQIFGRTTPPTTDVVVLAGTRVSTKPTSTSPAVIFQVQSTVTMFLAQAASYLNPVTGLWEITVPIIAVLAGASGNQQAGAIDVIVNSVDGISSTRNPAKTEGGQDKESNTSYAARISAAYSGSNTFTLPGRLSITLQQPNVSGANVVGSGNVLMQRDLGNGGKVDIYVQTNNNDQQQVTDELQTYSGAITSYIMQNQPVEANQATNPVAVNVFNNGSNVGTLIYGTHFTFVKSRDNVPIGTYVEWSSFAEDQIQLTPAGVAYIGGLGAVTDLGLSYTYDKRIAAIQAIFSASDGHALTEDIQVRKAKYAKLNVAVTVRVIDGFTLSDVQDSVASLLSDLYSISKSILGLGGIQSVIIATIQNGGASIGVSQVELGTLVLTLADGNDDVSAFPYTTDIYGNIIIQPNEFLQVGTVTLAAAV